MQIENERRFCPKLEDVKNSLFWDKKMVFIQQGYLDNGIRIRKEIATDGAEKYLLTKKTGKGISRSENEKEIEKKLFIKKWKDVRYFLIKSRYFVKEYELNIFHGHLAGYYQIEIEMGLIELIKFNPPSWFGKEVTDNPHHNNFNLAKFGIPRDYITINIA